MDPFAIRAYTPEDADWIARVHGELYQQDEGFDASFEPVVRQALHGFSDAPAPLPQGGWIAMRGPNRAGCIFCTGLTPEVAKIRLFLLLPEERGRGQGRQMLTHALQFAQGQGYSTLKIWTYAQHHAACRLYQRMGFRKLSAMPTRAYGRDLTEETWDFPLTNAKFS